MESIIAKKQKRARILCMQTWDIRKVRESEFPPLLREIPKPPETLWVAGELPPPETVLLTVVGSRKFTAYGKEVCDELISGLHGYDIAIVSGLAIGTDTNAHRAALRAGLRTIAVPGSGLAPSVIYPRTNFHLAEEILEAGGALLSEFEPTMSAAEWTFPRRNRIMAGLSRATLLIEASEKSGTLITARLASDYNRDVLVVPGSIFSDASRGTHQFLKLGATPVTSSGDILEALGFSVDMRQGAEIASDLSSLSLDERRVIEFLVTPRGRDEIVAMLEMNTNDANVLLMKMEIAGLIVAGPAGIRRAS